MAAIECMPGVQEQELATCTDNYGWVEKMCMTERPGVQVLRHGTRSVVSVEVFIEDLYVVCTM